MDEYPLDAWLLPLPGVSREFKWGNDLVVRAKLPKQVQATLG
ncbi:MAG: hypothetical protein AB7E72_21715 [Lysobacterales bacterium]